MSRPFAVTCIASSCSPTNADDYFQGCEWSPDGSCLLSSLNNQQLLLFELPTDALSPLQSSSASTQPPAPHEWRPVLRIEAGELVYDCAWYPHMAAADPATCCFAFASRAHPVRLADAFTGATRCSYSPYDDKDELAPPVGLAFSPDGARLFCGRANAIDAFDVARPGRDPTLRIATCVKGRKSRRKMRRFDREHMVCEPRLEQSGIISCFAFPSATTCLAAGSYDGTVGLYSLSDSRPLAVLEAQEHGVSQLLAPPGGTGTYLLASGRRSNAIFCWDLRNTSSVLCRFSRPLSTYQHLGLGADAAGDWLLSGSDGGRALLFPLSTQLSIAQLTLASVSSLQGEGEAALPAPLHPSSSLLFQPDSQMSFSTGTGPDCVNSVNQHPTLPLLATSSGRRAHHLSGSLDADDSPPCSLLSREPNAVKLWSMS